MRTRFLIDGDVVAFIAASAVQKNVQDENGMFTSWADPTEGEIAAERLLEKAFAVNPTAGQHGSRAYDVFLSDAWNWRLDVDPSYKSNRKNSVRPMLLDHLKEYLRTKHGAKSLPTLEADDAIGIAATPRKGGLA